MSKPLVLAAMTAAMAAAFSLAGTSSAEARKYKYRHGGVSIHVGTPYFYGGDRPYYAPYYYRPAGVYYSPYYSGRYEPYCRRWGWVYSRSGKAKWRCVAW